MKLTHNKISWIFYAKKLKKNCKECIYSLVKLQVKHFLFVLSVNKVKVKYSVGQIQYDVCKNSSISIFSSCNSNSFRKRQITIQKRTTVCYRKCSKCLKTLVKTPKFLEYAKHFTIWTASCFQICLWSKTTRIMFMCSIKEWNYRMQCLLLQTNITSIAMSIAINIIYTINISIKRYVF